MRPIGEKLSEGRGSRQMMRHLRRNPGALATIASRCGAASSTP